MEIGLVFPQTEIGAEPVPITRFAERAEERGFGHLLAYDHVLGANADRNGGWDGPYDHTDQFHEPLTVFSYLAGRTTDLEFVTGVLVLPQRQTALVAKQSAEVDRLTGGRFRLGVGVGWNPLEYVALDAPFDERGRRIEEQVAVLRRLWSENPTTFDGEFHRLPDVGINPLPVQQPIPLWMGGTAPAVLRRVGRLADGWFPMRQPDATLADQLDAIRDAAWSAGRATEALGIHGRTRLGQRPDGNLLERVREWRAIGADFLSINPMGNDRSPAEHVTVVDTLADAIEASDVKWA